MSVTLYEKKNFADGIKDLQMGKSSRFMVPKYNCMYTSERGRGRFDHRREGNVAMQVEIGMVWPQANARNHQKLGEKKKNLQPLKGVQPCGHLDLSPGILILDYWPLDCERIHFCHFKPPSLWSIFTAATGNEYNS